MADARPTVLGSVASLWRHPIKSMVGAEVEAACVTERGVLGDRAYALVDTSTGKVASAKNPGKWRRLFDLRATYAEAPRPGERIPAVRIRLPDGTAVASDESDINRILSAVLGREVTLRTSAPPGPRLEEYWPDIDGLAHRETVTEEETRPETFFDSAAIHLMTTATLERLRELYPQGRFEARRFRPNIVVEVGPGAKDFVDNVWVGRTLAVGDEVRLAITRPCPRCVMTTLPQGDLPPDLGILRAAAWHNEGNVGVYAAVLRAGVIRRGDPVSLA